MRIRKNASKLLGSIFYANPRSPSPIATDYEDAESSGIVLCELNSSPWDVLEFNVNPDPYYWNTSNVEDKEDEGSLGNACKFEVEPISTITSTTEELTLNEMKIKKKRGRKKRNDNDIADDQDKGNNGSYRYCKKTDGKGWHCKRHAQLPHTLCTYHLAQLRSYNSNHSLVQKTATDESAKALTTVAGEGSNLYYYYDGFGPCRGKRRGTQGDSKSDDHENGEGDETDIVEELDDGNDNCNDNVAGDDEINLDCINNDDDDNGTPKNHENNNDGVKNEPQVEKKKKKGLKKRGRKPIKARSLKSIL